MAKKVRPGKMKTESLLCRPDKTNTFSGTENLKSCSAPATAPRRRGAGRQDVLRRRQEPAQDLDGHGDGTELTVAVELEPEEQA